MKNRFIPKKMLSGNYGIWDKKRLCFLENLYSARRKYVLSNWIESHYLEVHNYAETKESGEARSDTNIYI
jgi:hypothetical protein